MSFWNGGEDKAADMGFAMFNKLAHQGINPQPINNRLMSLRIQLRNGDHFTLIGAYAPTMQSMQEEKEQFYEGLCSCILAAKDDPIIILGDFNACVDKDWNSWPNVISRHVEKK